LGEGDVEVVGGEGVGIEDLDFGNGEDAGGGDFVFDVAGIDGGGGCEGEVVAAEGFVVGDHEVEGDVFEPEEAVEGAGGGEGFSVGAGEEFDFIFVFALESVPGFPSAGVDAEGGAFFYFAEVEGDFGVGVGFPGGGGSKAVAGGEGGTDDAIGEFFEVGIAGFPEIGGGMGEGVGFVEGEVVAEGFPGADVFCGRGLGGGSGGGVGGGGFRGGVAVGDVGALSFEADDEGIEDGVVFAGDVDGVGGGEFFDELSVGTGDEGLVFLAFLPVERYL
jgi:hypothetical protein